MTTVREQLDDLARRERLALIRNWCYALGLMVSGTGFGALGGITVGNPKTWGSAYHALSAAGALVSLSIPLLGIGLILLITALFLTLVLLRKRHHGKAPSSD
jgi:hypothetical protein